MKLLHSPLCTLYLLSVLNESCMHVIFITSFITLDIARSTIRWRCRHGSRTRRARETRGGGLIESGRRSCGRLPSIIKMAQVSLCHSTAPQHLPFPASQSVLWMQTHTTRPLVRRAEPPCLADFPLFFRSLAARHRNTTTFSSSCSSATRVSASHASCCALPMTLTPRATFRRLASIS